MKTSRGQVTIFIIIGILIVSAVLLVLYFRGEVTLSEPGSQDPTGFIQSCVKDAVESTVLTILANGGEVEPSSFIMYQGEKMNYLCYQGDYYQPCYNIHPGLEFEIENEIRIDTLDEVQVCFDTLREDLEDSGYDVSGSATTYSIDLLPGQIQINLEKPVTISRSDGSQSYEDFSTFISSPLHRLVSITRDIVNSEARFCNFEYNGYMILYPDYDIKRWDYSDSKLYRVIDRATSTEFRFAVRSCAFPPGI